MSTSTDAGVAAMRRSFVWLARSVVALAAALGASPTGADDAGTRPFAVQLHVHGSFSEGVGSIDSHSREATDVGADVVWWSDHDFRISSYRHASTFGFEDWTEPLGRNEPWQASGGARTEREKGIAREPVRSLATGSAAFTDEAADEGRRSLRIRATSESPEMQGYFHALDADRQLFKRPLASGITVELSVLAETIGPDARPVIELSLSEHAPRDGLPLAQYRLRYFLTQEDVEPFRVGTIAYSPLRVRPGVWSRLSLRVTQDAATAFPWIRGEDNSLNEIAVGIQARRGAEASALFDRLGIRQEIAGPAAYAKQREVIDGVAAAYGSLTELQGVEISYTSQHLNEFSADTELLDYDALLGAAVDASGTGRGFGSDVEARIARRAVETAHAKGGLVSYNHMFGVPHPGAKPKASREEILAELVANQLYGADLIEVGYRERGGHDLADHLWVWDQLARHGLHPVGVGVSDSHGGPDQRWRRGVNNFLSWIYARSPAKADLIEGLRSGRVFFGDIVLFGGTLDLTTPSGFRMGQIVVTDRERELVDVAVEGCAAGDSVRVVEVGRTTTELVAGGPRFEARREVDLAHGLPMLVRAEVHGSGGGAKVLSNPITFVRAVPAGGLPAARAAVDLAGARSRRFERFVLAGAQSRAEPGASRALELRGRGTGGTIELELHDFGGAPAVELDGISGRWSYAHPVLLLTELAGEGTITLRAGD